MSRVRPAYFDEIRQKSVERWDQLERDPDLAGLWRQMFLQVRNPRHVLSELLQNADDAGATWVRAYLSEEGIFHFGYDGADFDEPSLGSLCRFGFSNKRRLHTIGFRGLGFKSTFSYGQRVEVITPSLAFAFEAERFTLPYWIEDAPEVEGIQIRIAVEDSQVAQRIRDDLRNWSENAVPLLFFSSISRLELQGQLVEKEVEGPGPTPCSTWLQLKGKKSQRVLRILSEEEEFPEETQEEVRSERNEETFDLPPCRVEVLLGLPGDSRLYAVLPTEVRPQLPFSCNAAFIQDPARNGIKEPVTSPTNRWLLERAGRAAARAMRGWLENEHLSLVDRAAAYELLPPSAVDGDSLGHVCTRTVIAAFRQELASAPILLSTAGDLCRREACLGLPVELLDVWAPDQAREVFGPSQPRVLAREVAAGVRSRLQAWGCLDVVTPKRVVERLHSGSAPPRPESWDALAALWAYLESNRNHEYLWLSRLPHLRITPVRGLSTLQAQNMVLSLNRRDPGLTASEWDFLESQVWLTDPGWQEFLQLRPESLDPLSRKRIERASALAELVGLDRHASLQQVFDAAAAAVFKNDAPGEAGLRLVWIAAMADLQLPAGFRFLCRDGTWHPLEEGLLAELTAELQSLLPSDWVKKRLIDSRYHAALVPRDRDRWTRWVRSGRSKLAAFPLPRHTYAWFYGRDRATAFCLRRGGQVPTRWYYQKAEFRVEDYDFEPTLIQHWERLANDEPDVWPRVVRGIAAAWSSLWEGTTVARVHDRHASNASHVLACGNPRSAWLDRLVGLPCIADQFGSLCRPAELLRRTPSTERFFQLKVARFLHDSFERSEYAVVLRLLGVREQLNEAGTLLSRIKALATIDQPDRNVLDGVISHYRALDQVWNYLPSVEKVDVKQAFASERLILDDSGRWRELNAVFQENDDALPGVAIVHRGASGLPLWDLLQVPRRPTIELALKWLKGLPKSTQLEGSDRTLLRSLIAREPRRVAEECEGWLDLSGRWAALSTLRWSAYGNKPNIRLLTPVKREIADVSMLPGDIKTADILPQTASLEKVLTLKLTAAQGERHEPYPAWLQVLAQALERFFSSSPESPDGVCEGSPVVDRETARRLLRAEWWRADELQATPYVDGTAAGEPFSPAALWKQERIYAVGSEFHYAPALAEALAAQFNEERARQAIRYCVARDPEFVRCYMQEHLGVPPVTEGVLVPVVSDQSNGQQSGSFLCGSEVVKTAPANGKSGTVDASPRGDRDPVDRGASNPATRGTATPTHRDYLASLLAEDGFLWDSETSTFINGSGGVVRKEGAIFPWVKYEGGLPIAQYWVGNRSLDLGMEIPAEVWHALCGAPDTSWLVLPGSDRSPSYEARSGNSVLADVDAGRLELAQAAYRIRCLTKVALT